MVLKLKKKFKKGPHRKSEINCVEDDFVEWHEKGLDKTF